MWIMSGLDRERTSQRIGAGFSVEVMLYHHIDPDSLISF